MAQVSLSAVYEKLDHMDPVSTLGPAQRVSLMVPQTQIVQFIAEQENIPKEWVKGGKTGEIIAAVNDVLARNPQGLGEKDIAATAKDLSRETDITEDALRIVIAGRNEYEHPNPHGDGTMSKNTDIQYERQSALEVYVQRFITSLVQQKVLNEDELALLERSYGLNNFPQILSNREISALFNVTPQRVKEIRNTILAKMRRSERKGRKLSSFHFFPEEK